MHFTGLVRPDTFINTRDLRAEPRTGSFSKVFGSALEKAVDAHAAD